MNNPTRPPSVQRREFLRQCAVIGGSATVVAAAGGVAETAPEEPAQPAGREKPRGYRLTPHIRDYYEKAGI